MCEATGMPSLPSIWASAISGGLPHRLGHAPSQITFDGFANHFTVSREPGLLTLPQTAAHQVEKVHVGAASKERPGVPRARMQLYKAAVRYAEGAQVRGLRPGFHAAAGRGHRQKPGRRLDRTQALRDLRRKPYDSEPTLTGLPGTWYALVSGAKKIVTCYLRPVHKPHFTRAYYNTRSMDWTQ